MSYDIGIGTGLQNSQISEAIQKAHDMPSVAEVEASIAKTDGFESFSALSDDISTSAARESDRVIKSAAITLLESCGSQYGATEVVKTIDQDSENNVQGFSAFDFKSDGTSGYGVGVSIKKELAVEVPVGSLGTIAVYVRRLTPRALERLYTGLGEDGVYPSVNTSTDFLEIPHHHDERNGIWWAYHESERPGFSAFDNVNSIFIKRYLEEESAGNHVIVDAICCNAQSIPKIVLSFDDAFESTALKAMPYMADKGLVGTIYLPTGVVGNTGRLTWAQVSELQGAGWGISLNGNPYDSPFTGFATVAEGVAAFTSQFADLESRDLDSDHMYHTCYPNGSFVDSAARTAYDLISDGSSTVTITATDVENGFSCYSYLVPDNTTVVSGGGAGATTLVLSNDVPAGTHGALFVDGDAEFAVGKLTDALKAVGVKSGRTSVGGGYLTTFGFAGNEMTLNGSSFSGMTLVEAKEAIDFVRLRGTTVEFYMHSILDDPAGWDEDTANTGIHVYESFFRGVIDYLSFLREANQIDVMTKHDMVEAVSAGFSAKELLG